jgi:hypothetical protein
MIRPGKNLRARLPLWFAPSLAVLLGFGGILRITFAQHMQRPVVAGRLIAMYAAVGSERGHHPARSRGARLARGARVRSGASMPSGARNFTTGIVVTNAGVLVSLLFGANSGHPNAVLSAVGVGVVAIGLVLLAAAAVRSRRARSGPRADGPHPS